jgi:uncharacterized C2H2 Zn-finger protein
MDEVLECGECGEVFSSEETLKKHADFQHGHRNVEIRDGKAGEGLLSKISGKIRGK